MRSPDTIDFGGQARTIQHTLQICFVDSEAESIQYKCANISQGIDRNI
jgi:hypothetical protein